MNTPISFKKHVQRKLYNQLFSLAERFVLDNEEEIEKDYGLSHPKVEDVELKKAFAQDLPGEKLHFTVFASLEVSGQRYRRDVESHSCFLQTVYRLKGTLSRHFDDLEAEEVRFDTEKVHFQGMLSDTLVPYLKIEELDKRAEAFLTMYYPEALRVQSRMDPYKLASGLGLSLLERRITEDHSIFGQLYYYEQAGVFYEQNGEAYEESVPGKTIVIDPEAFFSGNNGARNNTIVHECIHYVLHRHFFELEHAMNADLAKLSCLTRGGIYEGRSPELEMIEWQANALTPYVMMPKAGLKSRADELIRAYQLEFYEDSSLNVMPRVIEEIAEEYGVSRTSAKIRLIDAGYPEAIGCFEYVNGSYIPPYYVGAKDDKESTRGQGFRTYTLDIESAALLMAANPLFTEKVLSGRYMYIEGHLVRNEPLYIEGIDEKRYLTTYARHHLAECALCFRISISSESRISGLYHRECILNREKNVPFHYVIVFDSADQKVTEEEKDEIIRGAIEEEQALYKKLTNDFQDSMKTVRDWSGLKMGEIAEAAGLEERHLRRVFSGESKSLETLAAVLIVMKTPPKVAEHLIRISPRPFQNNNPNHALIRWGLVQLYGNSLEYIREQLAKVGGPAL
ncbi:MAG: ImmA/IrrE family metallo-endopeptidase [Lachnospiraceae bacterium]|nr:ImmA/IrrE family metallo-endopeptidase [Lachnospiraceae bacterium]